MKRKVSVLACLVMAMCVVSIAVAEPATETKEAQPAAAKESGGASAKPEMKLPPGWTAEDMQAMVAAGTPGKMHQHLAKDVGAWEGRTTCYMPGSDSPTTSQCTSTVTPVMDGRFIKVEVKGEMPGMGPYNGVGIYGFDNVSEKFVSTWIDNHSTGIMTGTGELSSDGKTLTWNYTANCPIKKGPVPVREVETITGANSKTLEMFGPDPKSGKEMKMMTIELTKKS